MTTVLIDQNHLDGLTAQAKASPRLRMNLDLRNSPDDQSQRMLNAIEPGSPLPIHRHKYTFETIDCQGTGQWHLTVIYSVDYNVTGKDTGKDTDTGKELARSWQRVRRGLQYSKGYR